MTRRRHRRQRARRRRPRQYLLMNAIAVLRRQTRIKSLRSNAYDSRMTDDRVMLRHFVAALAYRTQKVLRGAPDDFGDFQAGNRVRTPAELVRHMTSVLGYARTFFVGGSYRPEPLPTLAAEVGRFHDMLADIAAHLHGGTVLREITPEQLLQGPFCDAMTHVGQLALLRRLAGSPVAPENFVFADISPARIGADQRVAVRPDLAWPEAPPGWTPPAS